MRARRSISRFQRGIRSTADSMLVDPGYSVGAGRVYNTRPGTVQQRALLKFADKPLSIIATSFWNSLSQGLFHEDVVNEHIDL
jgi:hypothetical protein